MLSATEIERILPHRPPFLFIDRVVEVTPNESILAEHLVSMSSPILGGHFPGFPVLPGVVQVEAMAQAAVILAHASGHFDAAQHRCYFIGINEARFRSPVVPGDVLRIRVKAERIGRIGKFVGETKVGDEVKSTASLQAMIAAK
jgi:3-hydroxyacyl-[acyl-carrier-protein] dehydratase